MLSARLVIGAGALVSTMVAWAGGRELSRVGVHQGYAPEQPIAFSHKLHAGDHHISCRYCHFGATKSRHAGIPPANVCMNCHGILRTQTVEIEKLKEAVAQNRPIQWIKIHNLPDFVYFSHARHLAGEISCQACHGAIEHMVRVRQEQPLTMGWCLQCHRQRATAAPHDGEHSPPPGLDCGKCHY